MANLHRGEVAAVLGGRRRTLVLTLGALAELESAFAATDLPALAERFGQGRLMLAATELVLTHPVTGEELILKAPPEQSFQDVLVLFS